MLGFRRSHRRYLPQGRADQLYNEAGQLTLAYMVFRCWPSVYQALLDLDANANAVAIEVLRLENEGWARDASVTEPVEPGLP